jgi:hypothetical protein
VKWEGVIPGGTIPSQLIARITEAAASV